MRLEERPSGKYAFAGARPNLGRLEQSMQPFRHRGIRSVDIVQHSGQTLVVIRNQKQLIAYLRRSFVACDIAESNGSLAITGGGVEVGAITPPL